MSLILDALKKAEQDRHAGQAPALDELLVRRAPPVARRRRDAQQDVLAMAAIIMAALFAVAGLAYWLWPADEAPVAAVAAAAPADEGTEPPAAALRIDPERLAEPLAEAPETGVDTTDTNAAEAATMDELDGDQPSRATPSAPTADIREPATLPTMIDETTPAPTPAAVVENVRPLKEMPPAFRSELPKLSVDVHVYDDNPLRRFVLINGKKYRETDTLIDGPRVVEIMPNGVIVEHRGSKVLIELPR